MKPEVRTQWVAALRSGKYKQGKGYLRVGDTFCCLGVLCDISRIADWQETAQWLYAYNNETQFLPESVVEWAGLSLGNPGFIDGQTLAGRNDRGATFEEIANLIEKYQL